MGLYSAVKSHPHSKSDIHRSEQISISLFSEEDRLIYIIILMRMRRKGKNKWPWRTRISTMNSGDRLPRERNRFQQFACSNRKTEMIFFWHATFRRKKTKIIDLFKMYHCLEICGRTKMWLTEVKQAQKRPWFTHKHFRSQLLIT